MQRDCTEASFWLGGSLFWAAPGKEQSQKGWPHGLISPTQALAECTLPWGTPLPTSVPSRGAVLAPQDFLPLHSEAETHQAASAKRDSSRQQGYLLGLVRHQCLIVSSLNCVRFFCDPIRL